MPYLGDFLIFTAAGCSLFSLIAYFVAWRYGDGTLTLARTFFKVATGAVILALVTLLYLILTHDFTVAYVFSYSSTDLPIYYLWSSLWGGQEGTFLLWTVYVGIMGWIMLRTAGQYERGNMVFVNLFLLSVLLILLKKSPFELMPVWRVEGQGLNPLLQNYWMTIHPPIMFLGFAGVVFPFAFAMTALVERKYHIWSEAARRWTLFAWCALGVSLVMGGYWAYETLGWGGFWAWDPVENSSLIPWLFLTAQVHALFIKRQRRGLLRFSLIAACLSFWAVMYGTFLTRSGVLADFSVHSFVDLGINQFLVGGLFFFLILGIALLVWRWRDITPEPSYSSVNSRSYLVTLGILIVSLGGTLVALGTSSPLITRLAETPSNVGLTYYFNTMTPIAVAILLLLALFPAYRWNQGLSRPLLLAIGGGAAVVTIAAVLISGVTYSILYLLLFGFAAAALVSNGFTFYKSFRGANKLQAGYLSHVGLSLALIGATTSAGFATKQMVTLPQGQSVEALGYTLRFAHAEDTPKGFDCHVEVTDSRGTYVADLPHEFPKNSEGVMKKPFVRNYLSHDLYLSPVSLEQPQQAQGPGALFLKKGESAEIGPYTVTFHDFDVDGHGEDMAAMRAAARLTIASEAGTEDLAPYLDVKEREITPVVANFDGGKGQVYIAGIEPDNGGVNLQFGGAFVPPAKVQTASLVLEVSEKPLIILFWLGTLLAFLGGAISMVQRQRRKQAATTQLTQPSETEEAVVTQDVA
jgi:cytochrome c-type biogenesis protein CcmF